jgi:hypothetical protein
VNGGLFFDRNVPVKAVLALKILRPEVVGHAEVFAPDERDEVIVDEVARRGWSLLTRDAKMALRPRQRRVLLDSRLHVFINADGGNLSTWDFFVLLVRHYGAIERIVATEAPAIFFYTGRYAPRRRFFLDRDGAMQSVPHR